MILVAKISDQTRQRGHSCVSIWICCVFLCGGAGQQLSILLLVVN